MTCKSTFFSLELVPLLAVFSVLVGSDVATRLNCRKRKRMFRVVPRVERLPETFCYPHIYTHKQL